jgi:hypothetical protein
MGREVSGNMMEARHGVILLGEEFGIHLPRGVTSFLASLGPVGAAMEAAFPFLAIAVGATILIEHLTKMHEAGEKLTEDQGKFGTAVNTAFNHLDEKIIQAQIRSDELKNDHLGALKLQLELIDKQSMDELVHSFEEVAKTADVVMAGLTGSWYTWGRGSEGAKHALDELQNKYTQLMSSGKDADADKASGLLHGTAEQAKKVLGLLQQLQTAGRSNAFGAFADPAKFHAAADELDRMKIAHGETVQKQIEAQQNLLGVTDAMIGAEERIATLKKTERDSDKLSTAKTMSGQASAGAKESAESQQRIAQQGLAAARAVAEAHLTITRASVQERLAVDLDFANREYKIQMDGNAAQTAALNKLAVADVNGLKALQDKALELTATHNAQITELTAKASVAQAAHDQQTLEQSERDKIEATTKGSADRLAAINAAIHEEEAAGQANTDYYRGLLTQRVEAIRQEAEEESKIKDAAIKQDIAARDKASQEQTRHSAAMNKIEKPKSTDDAAAIAAELQKEYTAKHAELVKELADTQSMGMAKVAEQRRINAELDQLDQEHQDRMKEAAAAQAQSEKAAAMDVANSWGQSMLRIAQRA